jgi:putrescine aminotransferase
LIPAAGQGTYQRQAYRLHPAVAQSARHVNPAFVELLNVLGYGRLYERALDVWMWDHAGNQYLDCLAGFGSVNLGHNHPRLAARLTSFLQAEAPNHFHIGPSPYMAELAAQLAHGELEVTLFCNSGAEAVEAGLKLARAATGRSQFVYCSGGYHGTTLGALAVMGDERKRAAFAPDSSNLAVPFGDIPALRTALSREVAAFVVEPIQGEGGVRVPPAGYLEEAKALCRRHGALFILDEVQTGIGRTGRLFTEIEPDVRVLAKALGGGVASIGAAVTSRELHRKAYGSMDRFDWHSSTFGGNSFACVAASETLRILADEKLADNAAARGAQLVDGLKHKLAGHPYIRDIRGRGLLVGVEIGPADNGWLGGLASRKVFGHWVSLKLLERGIICQPAALRWDVLKIEPPLTIREAEIARFVDAIAGVFADYRNLPALLADVAKRLARLG